MEMGLAQQFRVQADTKDICVVVVQGSDYPTGPRVFQGWRKLRLSPWKCSFQKHKS